MADPVLSPQVSHGNEPIIELTEESVPIGERREPEPCDQITLNEHFLLDSARERLEESLCSMALWLDGLGRAEGDVLAARRSYGELETTYYYSDFAGEKVRLKLSVRVELPVLKRRLSAFVGLDNDDDFIRGRRESFALRNEFPQLDRDDEWLAGLGYQFPGNEVFRSEFRIGARRLTNTRVFVQQRFGYLAYSDDRHILKLREILFWTNEFGFGGTTGVDWMRVLTDRLLLRWDTVGTWAQETEGLDWRSSMILYQGFDRGRGLAYELFITGETDHPVPTREYGLRGIYRHPLFADKLIAQLVLGYTWPKVDPTLPREGSPGAGISLSLPFGAHER